MIQQFSENEIEIACFQYTNIVKRVQNIQAADAGDSTEPPSLKSIVYRLCTTPALYSGCEMALTVMLYNICVTVSECGIESLISSIAQSNTSTRPISHIEVNFCYIVKLNRYLVCYTVYNIKIVRIE